MQRRGAMPMSGAMAHVLEVERLSVRFGSNDVLRELSFSVDEGDSLAIIGPNGAGKSVLFRALVGSLPYDGRIAWAPGVRIGYVPQKLDLERDLPVTGVDLLHAKAHVAGRGADIAVAARHVGLGDEVRQPIGALSGGQFQRLLLALALVGQPTVLLLDEPTAGIDRPGQERVHDLVRRLQREHGLTLLLITHDLGVVSRYATRVLFLSQERTSFGSPDDVLDGLRSDPSGIRA